MEVIRYFTSRKLLTFIGATLVLQLSVIAAGTYLKVTLPAHEVVASGLLDSADRSAESVSFSEEEEVNPFADESELLPETSEDFADEALENETAIEHGQSESISIVDYTIQSGDTLTRVWQKHADAYGGGIRAAEAFEQAGVALSSLRVGTRVELQISEGDITAFRMELANGDVLVLDGDSAAGYSGSIIKPEIIEEDKVVSGQILRSFSLAAQRNEVPYALVDQLVDIFGARLEFRRDVQPGDTFTVMYRERRLSNGRILEPGPIKAASFENDGRWLVAVRHVDGEGDERYYDADGKPMGSFFLRYPLQFTRISSVFNKSRFHPVLKRRRPHNGVDFAAPIGTPIRSVADGVVSVAGYRGGAGNMVKIQHTSKYATAYLHLSKIGKGIRNGVKVKRGQVIGALGQSGLATGPHLHYAFYVNGQYVDPLKVELPEMPEEYEAIPANYLQTVLDELRTSHEDLRLALKNGARSVG